MALLDRLINLYKNPGKSYSSEEDIKKLVSLASDIEKKISFLESKAFDEINPIPINIPAGYSAAIRKDSLYFSHFSVNTPGTTSSIIIYNSYYADSTAIVGTYSTTSIYEKTLKCYLDSLFIVNQGGTPADITIFVK